MTDARLSSFLRESNAIEGIHRDPYQHELVTAARFLEMETLTLADLNDVQQAFAPGHRLRDVPGLDVRVGRYVAPPGGPEIRDVLCAILNSAHVSNSPYQTHIAFEMLHPYTDGNGRTGRILWAWHMQRLGRESVPVGLPARFLLSDVGGERNVTGLEANADGTYTLRYMAGAKVLERTKYHIVSYLVPHRLFWTRTEYAIHSEYMQLGGFKTRDEAHAAITACGGQWVEASEK